MHILLVPENRGRCAKTCFSHRQVLFLCLVMLVLLPIGVGVAAFQVATSLNAPDTAQLDSTAIAALRESVARERQSVQQARTRLESHVNTMALNLGRLQAQMMRVNALGQRLTGMAGLDKGEFNFAEEPAVGGPESDATTLAAAAPDFSQSLDQLGQQLSDRMTELDLLEAFLLDRQLQTALQPKGWPVDGGYVSSTFGYRQDPFNGRRAFHEGVDIANREGAPVHALASGVVTHAGEEDGYGLMVEINHGNGYTTRYAHTSEVDVHVGDKVEKGQQIALVGTSGRSTGPHLHFEILRNGKPINPRTYLRASN